MKTWEGRPEKFGYITAFLPRACSGLFIILFTFFWLFLVFRMPPRKLPDIGFGRYVYPVLPYFSIIGFLLGYWLFHTGFIRRFRIWSTVRYSVTDKYLIILENNQTFKVNLNEIHEIVTFRSRINRSQNIGTICFKCSEKDLLPVGMNTLVTRKSIPKAHCFIAVKNIDHLDSIIRHAVDICKD